MKSKILSLLLLVAALGVAGAPAAKAEDVVRTGYGVNAGDISVTATSSLTITIATATASLTISADTPAISQALGVSLQTQGNPRVAVSANFDAASKAATIACALYHYDRVDDVYTLIGVEEKAVTASAVTLVDTTRYPGTAILEFDTRGAAVAVVRPVALNTNNLKLKAWAYGSKTGYKAIE